MPHSSDSSEPLERAVHRTLRQLPDRVAPATLELRVMAEIERRAALRWWRKSFAHWPSAAKFFFVVVCVGSVPLAWAATSWIGSGLDSTALRTYLVQPIAWLHAMNAVMHALANAFEVVGRNIPPLWLYGGLAFFAALYAALFGLGAAAYKAVQAHP